MSQSMFSDSLDLTESVSQLPRPLAGVRILELARAVSGPYTGRVLADLGAQVVKVDNEDDPVNYFGEKRAGNSGLYAHMNLGKKRISPDATSRAGLDVIGKLARRADVLIENYRPGILAAMGLSWDELSADNPRLILLSISGFGQTGPESGRKAFAPVIHAESGILGRQSDADERAPVDLTLNLADVNAGLHGAVAVLAALQLRESTGLGQWIDLGMLQAAWASDDHIHYTLDNLPVMPARGLAWCVGGRWVMVAADPKLLWATLHTLAGLEDPTPISSNLATKFALRRKVIDEWAEGFSSVESFAAELDRLGLPWAPIRGHSDTLQSPTALHGDSFLKIDDRSGGERLVVRMPYRYSGADTSVSKYIGLPGEHNALVLNEWLGLTVNDVQGLCESGALRPVADHREVKSALK